MKEKMHSEHIRNDIYKGSGAKNNHDTFREMDSTWRREDALAFREVKQAGFKSKRSLLALFRGAIRF